MATRRSRCSTTLASLAVGLLAAQGAGAARADTDCRVTLYLDRHATGAQIAEAARLARAEAGGSHVDVISKETALAIVKRRHPELISAPAFNPLPAAIQIQRLRPAAAAAIARRVAARAAPGLLDIRVSGCS